MVKKFITRGKEILLSPQTSILSAATLIMLMIVASKILGFIRHRTLFVFFAPEETDLFLAAFELPDLVFEVFVYGILSASFIPVFSKYISRGQEKDAWHVASSSMNILLSLFAVLALAAIIFAKPLYSILAGENVKGVFGIEGGFSKEQIQIIVSLSRILFISQLFFVVSSFMTGVLESYKRFLVPAIAPLFYNLGIIIGTITLSPNLGLLGPTIGAVFGALAHLLVQIPAAAHLGFRPTFTWDTKHEGVKRLAKLAGPRFIEISFLQIRRFVWLFLGSLIAGGFTYLKSADLLQALPVGVFGLSLAKASLPTLSAQAARDDLESFRTTFFASLNQILFLVIPLSIFFAVLRVPIVRLVFGAQQFDWSATVQTGYVLSSFVVGIFAYAGSLLVSRAFYALDDTKTPVAISILSVVINALLGFVLVLGFGFATWGIALSYSITGILQFSLLLSILVKRIGAGLEKTVRPLLKTVAASFTSASVMYFLLKIFDRSVWVKRLSFLGIIEGTKDINFETFVLDTRYTVNLLILTISVFLIGYFVFIATSIAIKSEELWAFSKLTRRIFVKRRPVSIPKEEKEPVVPPPIDTAT